MTACSRNPPLPQVTGNDGLSLSRRFRRPFSDAQQQIFDPQQQTFRFAGSYRPEQPIRMTPVNDSL